MTIKYEHLVGIPYEFGAHDCYQLFRQFYADNWGIEMPDIAYPDFWYVRNPELNLIAKNFTAAGFTAVEHNRRTMLPGDAILMAIQQSTVNHVGVYLGGGRFLHHPFRCPSVAEMYSGNWFSRTMTVGRHPDVPQQDHRISVDYLTLLTPEKRARYEAELNGQSDRARGLDPNRR